MTMKLHHFVKTRVPPAVKATFVRLLKEEGVEGMDTYVNEELLNNTLKKSIDEHQANRRPE